MTDALQIAFEAETVLEANKILAPMGYKVVVQYTKRGNAYRKVMEA